MLDALSLLINDYGRISTVSTVDGSWLWCRARTLPRIRSCTFLHHRIRLRCEGV